MTDEPSPYLASTRPDCPCRPRVLDSPDTQDQKVHASKAPASKTRGSVLELPPPLVPSGAGRAPGPCDLPLDSHGSGCPPCTMQAGVLRPK